MVKDKYFHFQDSIDIHKSNVFCVEIAYINTKTDLFNAYNIHFKFPYFGFNWDALKDALCGLNEWMKEKEIIIIHRGLPHLPDKDLKIYIAILYDVCKLWEKYPAVLNFQVFFLEKDKVIIRKILEIFNSHFG